MRLTKFFLVVFFIAGLYDTILGLAFLIYPRFGFDLFGVTYPNHWGYVQFPAALLIVFGIMFFAIAFKPFANANLIPYGVLLKITYSFTIFGYWLIKGLPNMWKPFAVIDIVFAALFIWAYSTFRCTGSEVQS
jgi:hypothetical protein